MEKIKKHYILVLPLLLFAQTVCAHTTAYIKLQVENPGLLVKGRSERLYFIGADEASWSEYLLERLVDQESLGVVKRVDLDLTDTEMSMLTRFFAVTARTDFDVRFWSDRKRALKKVIEESGKFFLSWLKYESRREFFFQENVCHFLNGAKVTKIINRKKDCILFRWRRLACIAHQLKIDLMLQLCASYFVLSGKNFTRQIQKKYENPSFFWGNLGEHIKILIERFEKNFASEIESNRQVYVEKRRAMKEKDILKNIEDLIKDL